MFSEATVRGSPSSPKIQMVALVFALVTFRMNAQTTNSFKPDPAHLEAIQKLLREVPLIDGHNDLPWQYRQQSNVLDAIDLASDTSKLETPLATDFARLRAGGVGGQFWSVYIQPELTNSTAVQAVLEQIDVVHRIIARYPENLELALTADDVVRIHGKGKIASMIGMEGGHSINNSLATLRMMYALGARYMTLTHTKSLDWADAAGDEPNCHGLTSFGEEVVREMNRLGMMVDLSHVSDETMAAAIRISKAPVICSHSSARALCHVPRNVPDDLLKKMAANNGVVMVNFVPGFLTEVSRLYSAEWKKEEDRMKKLFPDDEEKVKELMNEWRKTHPRLHKRASLLDVADHIDHIRKVAGIDHVGIGGDYEGFENPPQGLEDVSCYPALLAELSRRGYSDSDLKKVAGLNILRVFHAVEKVAAQLQHGQR